MLFLEFLYSRNGSCGCKSKPGATGSTKLFVFNLQKVFFLYFYLIINKINKKQKCVNKFQSYYIKRESIGLRINKSLE